MDSAVIDAPVFISGTRKNKLNPSWLVKDLKSGKGPHQEMTGSNRALPIEPHLRILRRLLRIKVGLPILK